MLTLGIRGAPRGGGGIEGDTAKTGTGETGLGFDNGPAIVDDAEAPLGFNCSLPGDFGRTFGGGLLRRTLGLVDLGWMTVEEGSGGNGCPTRRGERTLGFGGLSGGSRMPFPR